MVFPLISFYFSLNIFATVGDIAGKCKKRRVVSQDKKETVP